MEPRDEGATRPAMAVVGSRWRVSNHGRGMDFGEDNRRDGEELEVVEVREAGPRPVDNRVRVRSADGRETWHGTGLCTRCTYLGMAAPPAPVGVRAGQRRKWRENSLPPFVVLSVDGLHCTLRYENDAKDEGPWLSKVPHIEKRSILLPDAPPATGVPGVAWAVGQRRRGPTFHDREATRLLGERTYVLTKRYEGSHFDWIADGNNGCVAICESWPSTLLADAPTESVTPGTRAKIPVQGTAGQSDTDPENGATETSPKPSLGSGESGSRDGGERPAPTKREVSRDGKQWVPYSAVEGVGFPFDSYRHRRVDGVVAAMATEPTVRVVGSYYSEMPHTDVEGRVCECEPCITKRTAKWDAEERARKPAPAPTPAPPLARRRVLDGAVRPWELP